MKKYCMLGILLACIFITACNDQSNNYKTITCTKSVEENKIKEETSYVIRHQDGEIKSILYTTNVISFNNGEENQKQFQEMTKTLKEKKDTYLETEGVAVHELTNTDRTYGIRMEVNYEEASDLTKSALGFINDLENQKTAFETEGMVCK